MVAGWPVRQREVSQFHESVFASKHQVAGMMVSAFGHIVQVVDHLDLLDVDNLWLSFMLYFGSLFCSTCWPSGDKDMAGESIPDGPAFR